MWKVVHFSRYNNLLLFYLYLLYYLRFIIIVMEYTWTSVRSSVLRNLKLLVLFCYITCMWYIFNTTLSIFESSNYHIFSIFHCSNIWKNYGTKKSKWYWGNIACNHFNLSGQISSKCVQLTRIYYTKIVYYF